MSDASIPGPSAVTDLQALEQQADQALRQGGLDTASQLFAQLAQADASSLQRWVTLALVHQQRGDDAAQEAALTRAQALDPYDLMVLLMARPPVRAARAPAGGRACLRRGAHRGAATRAPAA